MEKERTTKIIAVVALIIGVLGLSIGFAAFTRELNITFNESSVTPSGTLDVKFTVTNDKEDTSTTITPTLNDAVAANPATISNGTTISGLNATFSDKGQSVEYNFFVYNNSEYDAYLKNVDFLNYTDSNQNKVCTAVSGTSATMVATACNDIVLSIDIAGSTAIITSASSFTTPKIVAGQIVPVKVTIEYKNDETTSQLPNGDFKIKFGGIKLNYSSLQG